MFLTWRNEEPEYENDIFPDRDPHVEDPMRNEYCFLLMLKYRYFYEKEIVHSPRTGLSNREWTFENGADVVGEASSLSSRGS